MNWKSVWTRSKSTYNGLVTHCAPGTHEAAVSLLLRHDVPRTSVLDVASGTGAMLARLRDTGFSGLQAIERNVDRFQVKGLTPIAINLNLDFCGKFDRSFALITAVEIIEHLDSPRHFLLQVRSLLQDGGYLLLTTPNVSNWVGRIKFLVSGNLRWFEEAHYKQRHISPITDVQMRLMLNEVGFQLMDTTSAGDFFGPLKHLVSMPVSLLFRVIFGQRTQGDVNLYLATKSTS